jgi:hypothetical protein
MFRKIASPKPGWFKSGNDFSEKLYMTKSQFSPVHSILIHVPCFNVAQSLSFQAKLKTSLPPEARAIGFWITSTLSILFCQLEFTAKLCAVGVHSEALLGRSWSSQRSFVQLEFTAKLCSVAQSAAKNSNEPIKIGLTVY